MHVILNNHKFSPPFSNVAVLFNFIAHIVGKKAKELTG